MTQATNGRAGMSDPLEMQAQELLAEVFGMYKHAPTHLESELWIRLIQVHGGAAIMSFLQDHCLSSAFAPKPSEAQKALQSAPSADANAALELLVSEVRRCGPYVSPDIADPVIVNAVLLMGGWASLNNTMPSPESRYEFDGFRKRWEGCYSRAQAQAKKEYLLSQAQAQQSLLGHSAPAAPVTPSPRLLGIVEQARSAPTPAQVQALLGAPSSSADHGLQGDATRHRLPSC